MLRNSAASLLSRLAQCAPLARSALPPLLAAFVPEAFRSRALHVFARRPNADHAEVQVGDGATVAALKRAVIAELKLDAPPDGVRLLREVDGGGAPVPLDSRKALAEQGVREGASVLVEVLPPPHVLVRLSGRLSPIKVALAPGTDAQDFKAAAYATLNLGAPPDSARLLLEVEGGALVPLASLGKLSTQGVREGCSIVLEASPLPPPLEFAEEVLGGERIVVANLLGSPGYAAPHPFFITPERLDLLEYFLQRDSPFDTPTYLMVTGTIKSGKTRILTTIIPRLLSLYYARAPATAGRRRPIIFHHCFVLGAPAGEAAETLLACLLAFASEQGIALPRHAGAASDHLPRAAQALAEGIHRAGNKLWLLFDELGAPVVASSELEAARFVQLFKNVLNATHACAGTVATGSGMVALLKAVVDAQMNDFSLWGSAMHLRVGQEPAPAVALAMAQRLHSVYAPSWPS